MTTDEEQDLLRAMLVMAIAGLDAMAKQLVRDVLPEVIKRVRVAKKELEVFVQRRIVLEGVGRVANERVGLLARVLAAESQQKQVIEEYIDDLTAGSLQATEELIRTTKALGLEPEACNITRREVDPIFKVRNEIIHDLDMNLSGRQRKRNLRRQGDMVKHANTVLGIAQALLLGVSDAVNPPASSTRQ